MTKVLFINGSPERQGNTAGLAAALLKGTEAETLNLTDYRINVYGQTLPGDQFDEVLAMMKKADVLIIGSPVYWHNICGSVRNLLDRFYGPVSQGELSGKKLWFIYQGAAPEQWMMEAGEYTMKRLAGLYGMEYMGMISNAEEARNQKITGERK
jgi:multimeric flavodoxin WrbA